MKNLFKLIAFFSIALFLIYSCTTNTEKEEPIRPEYAIVIHGGAGNASNKNINEEEQKMYKEKLGEALAIGEKILAEGGTSIEAIEKTINFLENCP